MGDGDAVNFPFVLERRSDFVDQLLVRVRVVEKVERDAAQQSGGRFRPGRRQDGGASLDLQSAHALLVIMSEDVRDEVRPVVVLSQFQSLVDLVFIVLCPLAALLPELSG